MSARKTSREMSVSSSTANTRTGGTRCHFNGPLCPLPGQAGAALPAKANGPGGAGAAFRSKMKRAPRTGLSRSLDRAG
jgi:hypothetical protein